MRSYRGAVLFRRRDCEQVSHDTAGLWCGIPIDRFSEPCGDRANDGQTDVVELAAIARRQRRGFSTQPTQFGAADLLKAIVKHAGNWAHGERVSQGRYPKPFREISSKTRRQVAASAAACRISGTKPGASVGPRHHVPWTGWWGRSGETSPSL
jgi:hypothetical protein